MLDARRLAFSHAWETEREDRSQLRARILGGCSAHNACIVLAGRARRLRRVGPRLEPRGDRAVPRAGRARSCACAGSSRRSSRPWHRAFAAAAGDDAIVHPVNAVGTVRWNTAFAYLDPARERPNLDDPRGHARRSRAADGDRAVGVATTAGELRARDASCSPPAPTARPGSCCAAASARSAACRSATGCATTSASGSASRGRERLQRETAAFEASRPLFMAQVTVGARAARLPAGRLRRVRLPRRSTRRASAATR